MRLKISISDAEKKRLTTYIIQEMAQEIVNRLAQNKTNLEMQIKDDIRKRFRADKTILSLQEKQYGSLKGELGLDDNLSSRLEEILEKMLANMTLDPPTGRIYKNKFTVRYAWNILQDDYSDLLALDIASYVSRPPNKPPHDIDWLEWLLKGVGPISGYFIHSWEDGDDGKSRSEVAIMWRDKNGSRTWKMPQQFEGNVLDNFLTKMLLTQYNQIHLVITQFVEDVLS